MVIEALNQISIMSDLELMNFCANCRNDILIDKALMNEELFSKNIKDPITSDKAYQVDIAIINRDVFLREFEVFRELFEFIITQRGVRGFTVQAAVDMVFVMEVFEDLGLLAECFVI